jgi:hypothetical protein
MLTGRNVKVYTHINPHVMNILHILTYAILFGLSISQLVYECMDNFIMSKYTAGLYLILLKCE